MSGTPLIDKTKMDKNFLWKIVGSKWIVKFTCLCITLLLLLITGATLLHNYFFLEKMLEKYKFYMDLFNGHSYLLLIKCWLVTEGFILIAAVFGIVAILSDKKKLVNLYGIITFFAFVLNAVIGGSTVSTGIYNLPETYFTFTDLMEIYKNDLDAQLTIDYIQDDIKCCGYYGPSDWEQYSIKPKSCCVDIECSSFYGKGCNDSLYLIMTNMIFLILLISSTLSVLLLLGVLTIFRLKKKIDEAEEIDTHSKANTASAMQNDIEDSKKSFDNYSLKI